MNGVLFGCSDKSKATSTLLWMVYILVAPTNLRLYLLYYKWCTFLLLWQIWGFFYPTKKHDQTCVYILAAFWQKVRQHIPSPKIRNFRSWPAEGRPRIRWLRDLKWNLTILQKNTKVDCTLSPIVKWCIKKYRHGSKVDNKFCLFLSSYEYAMHMISTNRNFRILSAKSSCAVYYAINISSYEGLLFEKEQWKFERWIEKVTSSIYFNIKNLKKKL